jgi:signal transduction histidine kinase
MRLTPGVLVRRRTRPSLALGAAVAALFVVAETALAILLAGAAPAHTLVPVYLPGILLVACLWGLGPGLATALASAIVFDLVVSGPAWSPRTTAGEVVASLAVFLVVAVLAGLVSALARSLAHEAEARTDADLSAQLAGLLLRASDLRAALPSAGRQLARTLGLPSARIHPGAVPADETHATFPLRDDDLLATLVVPAGLAKPTLLRLRDRAVPSLESLLRAARQREDLVNTARTNYARLRRITDAQAALRNLATLVARSVPPSQVFDAVAREMAQVLGAYHTVVARYEADGTAVIVAGSWNYERIVAAGTRWELERGTLSDLVFRTRKPGRINVYEGNGRLSTQLRDRGVVSSVGCPIMVGCDLWGVAIASCSTPEPLPADTEERMVDFTELAATAIANAQSHADLIASRARVVAAADETRRRIERDLHDGTQQNLVSIGLEMRAIEAAVPPELRRIRRRLADTAKALDDAVAELQEIARGLHPAILARGGLKPALATLARRSALTVRLTVTGPRPLPECYEVTVYYIVSEALTNAAKHAQVSVVHVDLVMTDALIRLSIRDDGVGGADPALGSGLTGLTDRVNALGGRLEVASPAGGGTTLRAEIPFDDPDHRHSGAATAT